MKTEHKYTYRQRKLPEKFKECAKCEFVFEFRTYKGIQATLIEKCPNCNSKKINALTIKPLKISRSLARPMKQRSKNYAKPLVHKAASKGVLCGTSSIHGLPTSDKNSEVTCKTCLKGIRLRW